MKRVLFEDFYSWSVFNERRQIDFNGHLWVRDEGNVLIDPAAMIESDQQQLDRLGGAAWIVLTNRDHEREAAAFRERTGAKVAAHADDVAEIEVPVDRILSDGEEIVPGLKAIHLRFSKSRGEFALYWPDKRLVLSGDLVVGEPIGRLTLLADEKLEDPPAAALELRKLLALDFDAMLVGDGHSILYDARERLLECLEERRDIYINQVNADQVAWRAGLDREGYRWESKEIDALIGARGLGYRLIRLPPGKSTFPLHFHHAGEELFVILEGACTLVSPRGDQTVQKGDFLAFPPGPAGTHKFTNDTDEPCVLLAVGDERCPEVCEYPDSEKLNVILRKGSRLFRSGDEVDYFEGE
jgi:uncharacterized cupin superfamily protein